MRGLREQFAVLPPLVGAESDLLFSASVVTGFSSHRIGVDRHGLPCLLVAVDGVAAPEPQTVLENVSVQHEVTCHLVGPDDEKADGQFTLFRLLPAGAALHDYFIDVCDLVLQATGDRPPAPLVRQVVTDLLDLFRALVRPPTRSAAGVWAELFVISQGSNPSTMLAAWHLNAAERFDFALGNERLEVKAATGRVRNHHFSLDQVRPPDGVAAFVASVLLESSVAGESLASLMATVRSAATDPSLVIKVERVVAQALGMAWTNALDTRFDLELARSSLLFFDVQQVPKPEPHLPPEVTEVRFRADLSRATALNPDGHIGDALMTAAFPA